VIDWQIMSVPIASAGKRNVTNFGRNARPAQSKTPLDIFVPKNSILVAESL
jgi:hypothetical protein